VKLWILFLEDTGILLEEFPIAAGIAARQEIIFFSIQDNTMVSVALASV